MHTAVLLLENKYEQRPKNIKNESKHCDKGIKKRNRIRNINVRIKISGIIIIGKRIVHP